MSQEDDYGPEFEVALLSFDNGDPAPLLDFILGANTAASGAMSVLAIADRWFATKSPPAALINLAHLSLHMRRVCVKELKLAQKLNEEHATRVADDPSIN